jgi:prepilin-type processing-associated H-X9-DG protein
MGMAFRLWEGDHSDKYPMAVSVTNGGAMELIAPGKAYVLWQTVSNQIISPKVVWCPADASHIAATNFSTGFSDANISYFVNPDAAESYPQMIMFGDDNLLVNGKPVKPGILNLWTNQTIAWAKDRHRGVGNIGMADGSVQQVTSGSLNQAPNSVSTTGAATNRWLIP